MTGVISTRMLDQVKTNPGKNRKANITQHQLPPKTSQMTFRGGRGRRSINPETQTGTNTEETGGTNTRIEVHPGTSPGKITEASTTPEAHTEKSIEVTRGTLGTSLETDINNSMTDMIKRMNTEKRKENTIETTITPTLETDLEEAQGDSIETTQETGMMKEDRGRGVIALEMGGVVDMTRGEMMPAMGADDEMVARRP